MTTIHDLKIWSSYYTEINEGRKHHEIRKNNRGFKKGDVLHLREWCPFNHKSNVDMSKSSEDGAYTGYSLLVKVTYISEDHPGLMSGYVVMSIEVLK